MSTSETELKSQSLAADEIVLDDAGKIAKRSSGKLADAVETLALMGADVCALIVVYYVSHLLVHKGIHINAFSLMIIWLLTLQAYDVYEAKITLSVLSRLPQMMPAITTASMITIVIAVLIPQFGLTPALIITAWLLGIFIFPAIRAFVNLTLIFSRSRGYLQRRTLIVGAGEVGTLIAEKILRRPSFGLKLIGLVDKNPRLPLIKEQLGIEIFAQESQLDSLIKKYNIHQVIVTYSANSTKRSLEAVRRCAVLPVRLCVVPRMFEILATRSIFDSIEGIPLMELNRIRLKGFNLIIKRFIDIALSGLFLTFFWLPGLVMALAIKLDSPGPVFYVQPRVGKDGRLFNFYKFRSMCEGAESKQDYFENFNELSGPMFLLKNDPRVTRVGRILRRLSIDELPQLINVLKGDMSLVGPRPQVPREVANYKDWHKKRLSVTPGVTGPWQVLGRNELPFEEMVKLDLNYIQNWSLMLDTKLLLQTIPAVIGRRGAY